MSCRCRSPAACRSSQTLLAHMRRARRAAAAACSSSATKARAARRCCATRTRTSADEGRVIYQVGPDPSGLAAPFYPIRSLLAAMLQLPPVSSELELRDAVLGIGLNERDVPGIAQLFGHPTTLLELEPPVRRREMVWSTLRALERAAVHSPVTIVCEDIDRFDTPSLEILRRATESNDLALPPIVMTATRAFGEQWPVTVKRLEVGALEATDLEAIVDAALAGRACAGCRRCSSCSRRRARTRATSSTSFATCSKAARPRTRRSRCPT